MEDALRNWLVRLEPEYAHRVGIMVGQIAQRIARVRVQERYAFSSSSLGIEVAGISFSNPIGLAAGLDKDGKLLPLWDALGFGFVEVGSVTAYPSTGNPRPRLFRLREDEAIINRMGLPSQGARRVAQRINRTRHLASYPVGISVASTNNAKAGGGDSIYDFCSSLVWLGALADYVAINISCPNTADGTTYENPESLNRLLRAIFKVRKVLERRPLVFVKMAPPPSTSMVFDSQTEEILAVGRTHGVHGYIACNTASDRQGLRTSRDKVVAIGHGGLSGPPIRRRVMCLIRYLYNRVGPNVPIIGVGGVDSADAAYGMLRAGASLVQLYTALVYKGPGIVLDIKSRLSELCRRDRIYELSDAIGLDA